MDSVCKLDEYDQKIIFLLQSDPRRTNASIAHIIDKSESTVKTRIDRLINNRVLKILAVLNPKAIGYFTDVTIFLKVAPMSLKRLGEKLANINEVVYLSYITGSFDIIIEVLLYKYDQLFDFICNILGKLSEIISSESAFILKTEKIYYEWKFHRFLSSKVIFDDSLLKSIEPEPKKINLLIPQKIMNLDSFDKHIIELLQKNGRSTNATIARSTSASESTVKKRINRLVKNGVLYFFSILNPISLGYSSNVLIGIKVNPGQLQDVGRSLLSFDEIIYLGYHSGRFDILAEVLLKDQEELFQFISKSLGKISGIRSIERFHILHNAKNNYDWKLP